MTCTLIQVQRSVNLEQLNATDPSKDDKAEVYYQPPSTSMNPNSNQNPNSYCQTRRLLLPLPLTLTLTLSLNMRYAIVS